MDHCAATLRPPIARPDIRRWPLNASTTAVPSRPAAEAQATGDKGADFDLERTLAGARVGETAALGALYDHYSPAIYGYLFRRTGDPQLAEDLTSAVFLRMLQAIHDEAPWRDSFRGWLYRIAHNQLIDHLRQKSRHPLSALDDNFSRTTEAGPDEKAEQILEAAVVRRAINQLHPNHATVLTLRFAEGLSHEAVAARLGTTAGAAKIAQHRALKALKQRLARQGMRSR